MKHPVGSGFVGEIEGLGLVDLVQFACLAGDDRKLSVLSEDNRGVLYFSDNEIDLSIVCEVSSYYSVKEFVKKGIPKRIITDVVTIQLYFEFSLLKVIYSPDIIHANNKSI